MPPLPTEHPWSQILPLKKKENDFCQPLELFELNFKRKDCFKFLLLCITKNLQSCFYKTSNFIHNFNDCMCLLLSFTPQQVQELCYKVPKVSITQLITRWQRVLGIVGALNGRSGIARGTGRNADNNTATANTHYIATRSLECQHQLMVDCDDDGAGIRWSVDNTMVTGSPVVATCRRCSAWLTGDVVDSIFVHCSLFIQIKYYLSLLVSTSSYLHLWM